MAGIGHLDLGVLIPGGLGGLATVILFSKAVDGLFKRHYSVAIHAIVGIVIAATITIIPFASFVASIGSFIVNLLCLAAGIIAALWLDRFNQKHKEDNGR